MHPNRVPEDVEQAILDLCLAKPTYGSQRIANELRLQGVNVSPSGVRGVWLRHDLETRYKRLLRLEAAAREQTHLRQTDSGQWRLVPGDTGFADFGLLAHGDSPRMRFLFVGSELCLQLPSDPASRR